jgi:hypothetical protein
MLRKEQWLKLGAVQIEDDDIGFLQISALDIKALLSEAKERSKENAMFDDKCLENCKQISAGGNVDTGYTLENQLLCWKNRAYVPQALRQRVLQSEHHSKIDSHFGRERTLKLVTRNFCCTNMEQDIRKYCSEYNICQRMKAPRHA